MKQKKISLFLTSGLLVFLVSCSISKHTGKEKKSEHENIAGILQEQFNNIKDPATGTVPVERLVLAKLRQQELFANHSVQRAVPGISWQERGPNNVAGRIRAVLVDKNDASNKKVWVGGVNGGLWFTNDITAAAPVWNRVDDFLENLAITCLAQDPLNPGVIYAGTGEGVDNGAPRGLGIYKTTNAGATWTRLANTTGYTFVNDLEFDKNGKLYAAVRITGGGPGGVMRTADAGANWVNVLTTPTTSSPNAVDVALSKDGDLYASFGVGSAGDKGCIYVSNAGTAAGDIGTWANITPNASGVITDPSVTALWQRIRLATAPSDNNVLYAVMQGPASNICEGLMQYNKAINSWTVRTVPKIIDQQANPAARPTFTRDQAWWGLTAAVDPNNAAVLCVSGIDACRTTDNGQTWNQISAWTVGGNEQAAGFTSSQLVHADHHDFTYIPGSSSAAILATDGGIFYSTNINSVTKPAFVAKNTGLNITQFYAAALHPVNTNYFLGGSQDNGTHKFTQAGIGSTAEVSGGDGGFCHIDQVNGNVQISSYTNNNYYISTDGGVTFPQATSVNNGRGKFINPTDFDGTNLYGADDANHFYRINNVPNAGRTGDKVACAELGDQVSHVTISKNTAHKVYFGVANGNIVKVNNANAGTTVTGTVLGTPRAATVSSINFSLTNAAEDSMLVTYSNYGGSKVFLGTALNGTPAFRDITGNLPDMPVRWGMFDPRSSNMVIIATELGVWSCDDISVAAPQWNTTNNILANTRVDMLKYRAGDRTILAATHGRGMFTAVVPSNLNPEINFALGTANTAAEKKINTIGCRNFTDYDVQVNINGAPSANADITLTHSGTAAEGIDFDYTTNNVFGAGNSKVLSFASGSADSKSFKLRVYDDAIVDPAENVIFSFTLNNNGGNATIGTTAATQTLTINDNDIALTTGTTSSVASNVGGAADPAVNVFGPFNATAKKGRFQNIYTAAELTAAGLSAGSSITALGLKMKIKQTPAGFTYNGFNVKIAHTSRTGADNQFVADADFTNCYTGNLTPGDAGADIDIAFTSNFIWNGTSNIAVHYCWDNGAAPVAAADIVEGIDLPGQRGTISNTSTADAEVGCNLPTSPFGASTARATIKLTHYKPATLVETNLNAQKIENIQQNGVEYNFYSSNNNLIAGLKDVNAALGCVTTKLVNAGNGFTPFTGQPGTNRSNKVWSITPTTNGSTATYTVTLYMTTAELAGQPASGMKIYKSSAPDIAAANTSNTTTAPTVITASADGSWTSFTATFTGFSIFFIGTANIVIPVRWLNVNGNLNAQKQATINWQVQENNIAGYQVEKSTDGRTFAGIASIDSKGNGENNYSFTDVQAVKDATYYRIKQVDADGGYTYSTIVKLSNYQVGTLSVYPNPVKDALIISGATIGSKVSIADGSGKILQNIPVTAASFTIDMSMYSNGVYILKTSDGITRKIIKE